MEKIGEPNRNNIPKIEFIRNKDVIGTKDEPATTSTIDDVENKIALEEALEALGKIKPETAEIMKEYLQDKTNKEIAEKFKKSEQRISKIIIEAKQKMEDFIKTEKMTFFGYLPFTEEEKNMMKDLSKGLDYRKIGTNGSKEIAKKINLRLHKGEEIVNYMKVYNFLRSLSIYKDTPTKKIK